MATPAQIIDVLSARYTAIPGFIDLEVVVANYPGESGPVTVPYTWRVDEDYDNSWNVAAWFADHPEFEIEAYVAPEVPTPAAVPSLYAVAQLDITPGEITGIGVNSRFSAALYMDVGSYLIFFAETQPDTNYLAKAYDAGARVAVTERAEDYIVVTATDVSGDPTDPAEISLEIIRVG